MATDDDCTRQRRRATGDGSTREDRLAAALRENLRRRKAQQRARSEAPAPDPEEGQPEPPTGKCV